MNETVKKNHQILPNQTMLIALIFKMANKTQIKAQRTRPLLRQAGRLCKSARLNCWIINLCLTFKKMIMRRLIILNLWTWGRKRRPRMIMRRRKRENCPESNRFGKTIFRRLNCWLWKKIRSLGWAQWTEEVASFKMQLQMNTGKILSNITAETPCIKLTARTQTSIWAKSNPKSNLYKIAIKAKSRHPNNISSLAETSNNCTTN